MVERQNCTTGKTQEAEERTYAGRRGVAAKGGERIEEVCEVAEIHKYHFTVWLVVCYSSPHSLT